MILIVPVWLMILDCVTTHLLNLVVQIGGQKAICVFFVLFQYTLHVIQGTAVGQNNYDILPGQGEC